MLFDQSEMRFSDEYLEYWGDVFLQHPQIKRWYERNGFGEVAFLSFLQDPEFILKAVTETEYESQLP